jgi:hypothetical protein
VVPGKDDSDRKTGGKHADRNSAWRFAPAERVRYQLLPVSHSEGGS